MVTIHEFDKHLINLIFSHFHFILSVSTDNGLISQIWENESIFCNVYFVLKNFFLLFVRLWFCIYLCINLSFYKMCKSIINKYIYIYQKFAYFQNNVEQSSIYPEQLRRFKTNFINMFLTWLKRKKDLKNLYIEI